MKTVQTDVCILGGGLTAWIAAEELIRSGARVCMVRAGSGASPFIHGFCLPVLPEDSVECLYRDTIASGYRQGTPELVHALCDGTREIPAFLARLGIVLNVRDGQTETLRPLGASVPRVVSVGNSAGGALLRRLRNMLADEPNFTEIRGVAEQLCGDGTRIFGAVCRDADGHPFAVSARAVISACGGYSGILPVTTNPSDLSGCGLAMAYEAGVRLTDVEFIQFEPCVGIEPAAVRGKGIVTTMLFEGATLRNGAGETFMHRYPDGDRVGKDVMARRIRAEIERSPSPHGGVYFDATGVGAEKLNAVYGSYVARYAQCGISLAETPVEIATASHTALGGVALDCAGHTSLIGFYAAGEAAGGLHGANRMGGNAGLETIVFGRIVGQTVGMEWKNLTLGTVSAPETPARVLSDAQNDAFRARLDTMIDASLNLFRSESGLQTLLDGLDIAEAELNTFPDGGDARAIRSRITAARLVAISSQMRKGSVGCFQRTDARPETGRYVIDLQKINGELRSERRMFNE